LEMAAVVIMDMSRAVELATGLSDHAHAKRMIEKIRIARLDLQQEIAALRTKNGGKDAMLAYYNNLLQAVQKRQYAAARVSPKDPAFLEQVLNGVAMITGSGDFIDLVKIGMLLGVMLVAFQAIVNPGQGIQFQHVLLAFIVYSIMYGPRATTIIQDVYTGQTRMVANVPYGVAATGGILSSVGFNVAQFFEQA